ncbi:hypothetical protein [Chimpanzee faeces associated microphage 2]|uniref:hypothetical protein n=1 Tax=Chimpanzee faeces associated microphage 2 TaxID=1676182 RepID=UPI0007FB6527|nr:hypothetical protein [Chimpanzee faeces associated microphage 2]AKO71497.1 hypothetical protein [Chimpanzee faeces associated microphage 2]
MRLIYRLLASMPKLHSNRQLLVRRLPCMQLIVLRRLPCMVLIRLLLLLCMVLTRLLKLTRRRLTGKSFTLIILIRLVLLCITRVKSQENLKLLYSTLSIFLIGILAETKKMRPLMRAH